MLNDIETRSLVVKITGAVQQSNMKEFDAAARQALSTINLELVTDDDFSQAENDVKSCQFIESRIAQSLQDILTQTADIAEIVKIGETIREEFRKTRLTLEKKIKTEKESRKNQLINDAIDNLKAGVSQSPVQHGFAINTAEIIAATKGKRFLGKMQEAIDAVVLSEQKRLFDLEDLFVKNINSIEHAEKKYPGLFPDKSTLALQEHQFVLSMIDGRIAKYRYDMEMKEKARIEAEMAAQVKIEVKPVETPTPPRQEEGFLPPPPPPSEETKYVLLGIITDDIDKFIDENLSNIKGVCEVHIQ